MTEIDPYYQKGRTSVEHRNIDAAGEDHPFGDEPKEFEADLRALIRRVADDLYDSWRATLREYLANAETATLKVAQYCDSPEDSPYDDLIVDTDNYQPKIEVVWNKKEEHVIIKDNGIGMAGVEVDQIFRQIGRSAARDNGSMSGQFGQGALSFVKFVGLDNSMIMLSHSRLNDDNAAYLVSLAGVEPIMGSLSEDEYGTKFQLTPQEKHTSIRDTIKKYSEWMRVPVIYREIDTDGTECFNEDWGDKKLYDEYSDDRITLGLRRKNAFDAYCSPVAESKTLLLSMSIDRNEDTSAEYTPPFSVDIRLLDESGKVIESTNGNEGLMPVSRTEYEQMLLDARSDYITKPLLSNQDIALQTAMVDGEEVYISPEEQLDSDEALPMANYVTPDKDVDAYGPKKVIIGPHKGRIVLDQDEWSEMPLGRAKHYVPEDELEPYDVESGEGDLCLPEPTSDRDRLQRSPEFWDYLSKRFNEQFNNIVMDLYDQIEGCDNPVQRIEEIDPDEFYVTKEGFGDE